MVLEHLARTLDLAPIAVCVTSRSDGTGRARVSALAGSPSAATVPVQRLDRADQRSMTVRSLGGDAPAEVIDFVIGRAEGLPPAVEELLADLRRNGALVRAGDGWLVHAERFDRAWSPSIEAAVEARLARIDADAVAVAVAVALRDDDSTWDEIAAITGQPADRVVAGLKDLAAVDLLVPAGRGRYRFRHGLILDAVLAAVDPSLARPLARRAAGVLDSTAGDDPDRLSRAARLAERAGDAPGVPSPAHTRAARLWLAQGAGPTALLSARRAVDCATSAPDRAAAVDVLSEALTRVCRFAEALIVVDTAAGADGATTDRERALAHCRAARCALETGRPATAHRHLDLADRVGGVPHEVCALRATLALPLNLRRFGFTSREMDVLLLVARHLTNAQIADRLTLSPRTVDTHVSRLIAKAQVSGRTERAALLA